MTGPFNVGDIVAVDVKGRYFVALVDDVDHAHLDVSPLTHNISYRHIRKRDIKTHWRRKQGGVPMVKKTGGITYG